MLRALVVLVFGLTLSVGGRAAHAGDADFRLGATSASGQGLLFECTSTGACTPRNDRFRGFVGQLGQVLAPRSMTPSETLGHSGFHVGAMWSGSFVANDEAYWGVTEAAQRTGSTSGLLSSLHLDVRKGLPLDFELAAQLQWLADSEIFAPGAELRWALEEYHPYMPDIGLMIAVNHVVGARDLSLTNLAFGGGLSRDFGLFGMMNLTPYAAWTVLMSDARSGIVDPRPTVADDTDDFVFDSVELGSMVSHRLTLGLRLLVYIVNVSAQGELRLLGDGEPAHGISVKFGLDF